jgi:hypothetical protein
MTETPSRSDVYQEQRRDHRQNRFEKIEDRHELSRKFPLLGKRRAMCDWEQALDPLVALAITVGQIPPSSCR